MASADGLSMLLEPASLPSLILDRTQDGKAKEPAVGWPAAGQTVKMRQVLPAGWAQSRHLSLTPTYHNLAPLYSFNFIDRKVIGSKTEEANYIGLNVFSKKNFFK